MAGLGLADLSSPPPELDAECAPPDRRGRKRFESADDAAEEDRIRLQLLNRQANKQTELLSQLAVKRLWRSLSHQTPPASLASARYLHELRRRIVGAVWKLVRDED